MVDVHQSGLNLECTVLARIH